MRMRDKMRMACYGWEPRKNQPERFDEQEAFFKSKTTGVSFCIGGNGAGCLGAEQAIYDPVRCRSTPVSEIRGPFHVWARDKHGRRVVAKASMPRIYGVENLYEVTLSNGQSFVVTAKHRVMSAAQQWQEIRELACDAMPLLAEAVDHGGPLQRQTCVEQTTQTHCSCQAIGQSRQLKDCRLCTTASGEQEATNYDACARLPRASALLSLLERGLLSLWKYGSNLFQTAKDSTDHCSMGHRLYGELPQFPSDSDQVFSRQLTDVLERNLCSQPLGVLATSRECIHPCRSRARPSRSRFSTTEHRAREEQYPLASRLCSQSSDAVDTLGLDAFASTIATLPPQECRRLLEGSFLNRTSSASLQLAKEKKASACLAHMVVSCNASHITSVRFLRRDSYWDFSVEEHENYWMGGVWHHNTSEVCCAKLARFVLCDQPPPRPDTPFWIISGSYEQVMETAWKEKLYGHGHIPDCEVDWERVSWYKPNQNWPFRVPLKPWPRDKGGNPRNNWVLELKSYEQGRAQLQARSVGGFCFMEQFPWDLLTEVLRGCREYNFPGSKFCEFTPIDPDLSVEIEEMAENGHAPEKPQRGRRYLPKGWEVFRANTECAMEAGHISKDWFEEFFSMIPEEMRETRMTGRFATYEGAVYSNFNPAIHLVDDDVIDFPPGVFYRRAIDWGAGPENPFCCLFAYKNAKGQWYIFDEYYSAAPVDTVAHLCEISKMSEAWGWRSFDPHYGTTYADPSSLADIRLANNFAARCPHDEKGEPLYESIPITAASNSVNDGIHHMQWLLQPAKELGDEPRLFIHKTRCPNLARQMRTYRWKKGSVSGLNPSSPKKEPVKKDDHAADACRYLTFTESNRSGVSPVVESKTRNPGRHGVQLYGARPDYRPSGAPEDNGEERGPRRNGELVRP